VKFPRHLFPAAVAAAAISALVIPRGFAGVVLNELNAGSSERLLRWDASGVPRLGTGLKWYESAFSDAQWDTAIGPFGYGGLTNPSVPIATGLEPKVRYLTPTVYYRKNFSVTSTDAARTDAVQLIVEYNDGFVAYLNGVEVARRNAGPVNKFIYHRRNLGAPSIQFHMDTTSTLGTWTLDGGIPVGSPVNNGDGTETLKRRDTQSTSDAPQRFLRLRINN
jgi:hypothetical protein